MLNCASEATPLPEGQQGAYGIIRASGRDVISSYDILLALIKRDRSQAQHYLQAHGFTAEQQDAILAATHCAPPESYLITGTPWLKLGSWDMRRAYIARRAPQLSAKQAVNQFTARLGYTKAEAKALYTQARQISSEREREAFILQRSTTPIKPEQRTCRIRARGMLICPVNTPIPQRFGIIDTIIYNPAAPMNTRLRMRPAARNRGKPKAIAPALIIVADQQGRREILPKQPGQPEIGLLVDQVKGQILLGRPSFIRSTYVELNYLDARYTPYFEKFEYKTTISGEPVSTWRIHWDGR